MKFYDTCALLHNQQDLFEEPFYISVYTLNELENIKTAANKDPEIKYKARKLIRLLIENQNEYKIVPFTWEHKLSHFPFLPDNNDSRIILTAYYIGKETNTPITFVSKDLCCCALAQAVATSRKANWFNTMYPLEENQDIYTGFKIVQLSEQEQNQFYNEYLDWDPSTFNVLNNEYLIIQDSDKNCIDSYICKDNHFEKISYPTFISTMFGKVKPKDIYQKIAMDSLSHNQITMIRGAAGTGKSYLSFAYLFQQLEHHEIDKIIIFCNTVATTGSAKLGFYPGTRDEKLLDSQIGNLLASKLGDKMMVEEMIADGRLVLLPMSDIRGYDTTGMNAGIYISEAQNMDIELMRLALQRIGEDSFCILDGDSEAQVDLPVYAGSNNGMRRVSQVFRGDSCYGEITLQNIHRSHIAELAQKL